MEFNFRRSNSEMEHNDQMYHTTPYFNNNYTSFSIQEGLRSGTSYGGVEILRGSMETIQRQLEKKRIREEILAEEAVRRRVLEAEVRRELMLEKYNGGGSFLVGSPVSRNTLLEPAMQPIQPFSPVETYGGGGGGGGGGHHRREIGEFEAVPFQRSLWLPGDGKLKEVVDLEKLNDSANPEPPPLRASASSSELKHCTGVIGLGVGPKKLVKKQPLLIKNSNKRVSKKEIDNKSGFPYWCGVCGVGASSETNMNQHNEGKKHMKNLEKGSHGNLGVRKRSSGIKSKKTKQKQKSHKAARHRG